MKDFNRALTHGIFAGLIATVVGMAYTTFYFSQIVDFSDGSGWLNIIPELLSRYMLITIVGSITHYLILKPFVNAKQWGNFVFALLFNAFALGLVVFVLKMDDPTFKTEDAQLMGDFFKGFLMPLVFIPFLSWYLFSYLFKLT
jgi:hypothetical protein